MQAPYQYEKRVLPDFKDQSKIYEIDVKSIIKSFDFGRLISNNQDLVKLDKDNIERFLRFPEDILLLNDEENQVVKRANFNAVENSKDQSAENVRERLGAIIP